MTPLSSKNNYDTDGIAKLKSKRTEFLRSHLCCRCGIMNNIVIFPSVNAVLAIVVSSIWQVVGSVLLSNFHFTLVKYCIKNCSPIPYQPMNEDFKRLWVLYLYATRSILYQNMLHYKIYFSFHHTSCSVFV
jgi:hypothetical protein